MVELATFVQVLIMIGAPIVLARWIHARWALSWRTFGVGGATWLLSQVGHMPFNAYAADWLPPADAPWFLPVASVFFGS